MLTTIVLSTILANSLTLEEVSEYFPLNSGDKWVYQEKGDDGAMRVTDTVGEEVTIKGTVCTPVITTRSGKELDRVYYSIGEGEVRIVGFDAEYTIEAPYPIVRLPERSSRWSHTGDTVMGGAPADLSLEGSVKKIRQQEFNGKKIDAIEVKLVAIMLAKLGTKFTVTQVAIYGKGIGLISMNMKTELPKRKIESSRTLLTYTPKTSE